MLIFHITNRFLREILREKITIVVILIMPAFMGFMFWFAFSTTGLGGAETYQIGVINNDQGIADDLLDYILEEKLNYFMSVNESTLENGFAFDFIQILNSSTYPVEEGKPKKQIFEVSEFDMTEKAKAIDSIEERLIDALLIFPEDYSNTTLSAFNNAFYIQNGIYIHNLSVYVEGVPIPVWSYDGPPFPISSNSSIDIIGDEGFSNYQIAKIMLNNIFTLFNEEVQAFKYSGGNLNYEINSIALKDYSVFDTIVPGILVFAALMQAGILAAFLVAEIKETKTIARIRLSLIKPYEYVFGAATFSFIASFAQLSILMGFCILILGFSPAGSVFEAMIVLILTTIFTTALGFILAGFFNSAETAGQSSGFLMTPLAFMSGAFVDIPKITLIPAVFPTASGLNRDFLLWDILPSTHAVNSLRSILLYEFSIFDVWVDVVFIIITSIILLLLGMIFYTKKRFTGDIMQ